MAQVFNPMLSFGFEEKDDVRIFMKDDEGNDIDITEYVMSIKDKLADKVNVFQGSNNVNKVLVTDATGNVTVVDGVVMNSNERNKLASITNPMILKGILNSYEALYQVDNPQVGWCYLITFNGENDNIYKEYVYTADSRWELLGNFNASILPQYFGGTSVEVDNNNRVNLQYNPDVFEVDSQNRLNIKDLSYVAKCKKISEINALQSGTIFHWQGATDRNIQTIDPDGTVSYITFGYFYKKDGNVISRLNKERSSNAKEIAAGGNIRIEEDPENDKITIHALIPKEIKMVYFLEKKAFTVDLIECIEDDGELRDKTTDMPLFPVDFTDSYCFATNTNKVYKGGEEWQDVTSEVAIEGDADILYIDKNTSKAYYFSNDTFKLIASVVDTNFTEANTRTNINSGDSVPTIFGKIKKWFKDLGNLAFKSTDGNASSYLKGDGTWATPPNTTYTLDANNEKVKLTPSQGSASEVSLNSLINGLSKGNSDPQDDDYVIAQYAGGGTTTITYHRRPLSKFWNWIKSKLGSVGSAGKPIYYDNGVPTECGTFATLDTTGETIITTKGADLNDYTTVGVYGTIGGYGGSTVADSLLNRPSGMSNGGIKMVVQTNGGSSDYKRQIIYHKNGDIFTRVGYLSNDSYIWLDWKQINDTDTGATSVETTGSGNAVTSASYSASNRKITLTKGLTFLTSQDISGKVNKTGDTITGTLILSRTTDASGTANNKPALIVGGTDTQAHIEIDNNEIIAKSNGTTEATLYLNNGNGNIYLKGSDYTVTNPDKFRAAIGAGTSSLEIGTTASTAAAGNHTHKYAGSSSVGGAATSAAKLTNTSKVGDTNKPVYFTANGVPAAISYTIEKSVPSDAVFTDTTYSNKAAASGGTAVSLCTTGEKYTWNNKQDVIPFFLFSFSRTNSNITVLDSVCFYYGKIACLFISFSTSATIANNTNLGSIDIVSQSPTPFIISTSDGSHIRILTVNANTIKVGGTEGLPSGKTFYGNVCFIKTN